MELGTAPPVSRALCACDEQDADGVSLYQQARGMAVADAPQASIMLLSLMVRCNPGERSLCFNISFGAESEAVPGHGAAC